MRRSWSEKILFAPRAAFALSQTDYGLKIASVAGGTSKLKDELKCAYFIIGRR